MLPKLLSAALLGLLVVACASPRLQSGQPVHNFPTQGALAQIAATARAQPAKPLEMQGSGEWDLEPPQADLGPEQARFAALSPEFSAALGGMDSKALSCVAHELARAIAASGGSMPAFGVRRFIAGRCGALISTPAAQSWTLTVPEGTDPALIESAYREQLRALQPAAVGIVRGMHTGFGAARVGERVAVVAAFGEPLVQLDAFSRVADAAGRVTIRGRVTHPSQGLRALINRGTHGVAPCVFDPAFALPEFAFSCELDPADDHAWLELISAPPGRLMARPVLEVLALRRADGALSYRMPEVVDSAVAQSPADFRLTTLRLLNQVRATGELAPLSLSEPQSQIASDVTVPFFQTFASAGAEADAVNSTIALGLLAGWSVQGGMIQSADLTGITCDVQSDAGHWLSSALELPMGRAVLLDPHASQLALGVDLMPVGVAGLAVTYRFVDSGVSPDALAGQILKRLKAVRDARHLGNTVWVTDTPGMQSALERIRVRGEAPMKALDQVLQSSAFALGRDVSGFVWETHDLEAIEFPDQLLRKGDLYLGAGVAQYRPQGAAWAQYAVLFAIIGDGQVR